MSLNGHNEKRVKKKENFDPREATFSLILDASIACGETFNKNVARPLLSCYYFDVVVFIRTSLK